jgi:tetratricopeptide (TPR) repeat protein
MSALAWCDRSASGAEFAARLVSVLKYYWLSRGTLGSGYAFARTAVELALQSRDTTLQARTRSDAGMIAIFVGKYDEAREHLERGLALARVVQDAEQEFVFLQYLAEVESASGHFDAALNHCEAAHHLAATAGKERMLAVTLNSKGQVLRAAGRLSEADALYREALASARSLGDVEFIAGALMNRAMVAVLQHRPAEVPPLLDEVVAIEARLGSQATGQSMLEVCAGLAAELEVWDSAAEFIAAAETQARRSSLQRDPADQAFVTLVSRRVSERSGAPAIPVSDASFDFAAALLRATDWVASLRRHAS